MGFCPTCSRLFRDSHREFCSFDGAVLSKVTSGADPLEGVVFEGAYRLIERLGAGGNGVVYKAEQLDSGLVVALKMLYAERSEDPRALGRFRREARAMALLDHSGCVKVLDYSTGEGDVPYLVMELAHGQPLGQVAREIGIAPAHAMHICAQVADAIAAAHEAGIVHRDLKPENIILDLSDEQLRVRLIDFGLAILEEMDQVAGIRLTQRGLIVGTPEYMSPEQIVGGTSDARTDIYSLGIVAYELLSGAPPFCDGPIVRILAHHLEETPAPLPILGVGVDVQLETERLVMGLLAKESEERPQSATEVARSMRLLEAKMPAVGPPSGLISVEVTTASSSEFDQLRPLSDPTEFIETPRVPVGLVTQSAVEALSPPLGVSGLVTESGALPLIGAVTEPGGDGQQTSPGTRSESSMRALSRAGNSVDELEQTRPEVTLSYGERGALKNAGRLNRGEAGAASDANSVPTGGATTDSDLKNVPDESPATESGVKENANNLTTDMEPLPGSFATDSSMQSLLVPETSTAADETLEEVQLLDSSLAASASSKRERARTTYDPKLPFGLRANDTEAAGEFEKWSGHPDAHLVPDEPFDDLSATRLQPTIVPRVPRQRLGLALVGMLVISLVAGAAIALLR